MNPSSRFLNPAEAARRLGVSAKALRLYEQRGLLVPARTAAGWRSYGPAEMARATEIVALRALGLSLAQVARVLKGDAQGLAPALAAHQAALEAKARELDATLDRVRGLRDELARGLMPAPGELARLLQPDTRPALEFELPWPWGGERFALSDIRPSTTSSARWAAARRGSRCASPSVSRALSSCRWTAPRAMPPPRGCAKTPPCDRASMPRWPGSWRTAPPDPRPWSRCWPASKAEGPAAIVVDMVEQGLDHATQEALIAHLRRRGAEARPLFLLTRSSAFLDLAAVGAHESILLCPANHSPPTYVAPFEGAPGYEAVATCLATPEVRARTQVVIAWRPTVSDPAG